MPALEVSGAYTGVATFRAACNIQDATRDALILEHLLAASREIERLTLRRFYPYTATNMYRWPPLHVANSYEIWTEDDLLTVTSLQVAAAGQKAVPVAVTKYFLEPQYYGPPYNRVEIDLSSTDIFQSGPTPQRSVQITGQWGYSNTTVPIGTLNAQLASTDTTINASAPTAIEAGDVLLIENESIFVDLAPGTGIQTLRRGVNGTTAALHTNGTPIAKYQAPAAIRRVVRADAIGTFQEDLSAWSRNVGSGEMAMEWQGKAIKSMRQTVIEEFRRARFAAV